MNAALERARAAAGKLVAARATTGASILDAVTGLARVKAAAALAAKVAQYRESGLPPLERLRLVRDINALVAELGGKASDLPALKFLREVASGRHDGLGASDLLGRIGAELSGAWGASYETAIDDESADAAHAAINQWMKVEEAEYA